MNNDQLRRALNNPGADLETPRRAPGVVERAHAKASATIERLDAAPPSGLAKAKNAKRSESAPPPVNQDLERVVAWVRETVGPAESAPPGTRVSVTTAREGARSMLWGQIDAERKLLRAAALESRAGFPAMLGDYGACLTPGRKFNVIRRFESGDPKTPADLEKEPGKWMVGEILARGIVAEKTGGERADTEIMEWGDPIGGIVFAGVGEGTSQPPAREGSRN